MTRLPLALLPLLLLPLLPCAAAAQARGVPALSTLSLEARGAEEPPPLSGVRVAGQLAAGTLGGVLGAIAVGLGSSALGEDSSDGWEDLAALAFALAIGYPLGSLAGVYLAGSGGGQRGSFLATLLGTAAGAAGGALLAERTQGVSYLLLVPVGGTLGFNLTRRAAGAR